MFINKNSDGLNNICGKKVYDFRKEMNISQRKLADLLQLDGLDIDKNAVQRIECGKRFVTDIELLHLAKVLKCSVLSFWIFKSLYCLCGVYFFTLKRAAAVILYLKFKPLHTCC